MSGTITGPQVRVRINHTRTAKDGWRLSETTVEIEGTLHYTDAGPALTDDYGSSEGWRQTIGELLQEAHSAGEAEAQRRNNAERQDKLYGPGDPDMSEVPF